MIMKCSGCNTMVIDPRLINYMYEKCTVCTQKQKEQEEYAIDVFIQAQAEKKLEQHASEIK